MTSGTKRSAEGQLQAALRALRRPAIGISGISCLSNVLMLTGPMFMMLVYNKVLSSKSLPTLAALSLLALLLYVFYGLLEGLRGKLMARIGITFDRHLAPMLFEATLRLPLFFGPHARNHDPLQDLALIRNYPDGCRSDRPARSPVDADLLRYPVHGASDAGLRGRRRGALPGRHQHAQSGPDQRDRPRGEPGAGRHDDTPRRCAAQRRGGRGHEHGRGPLPALGSGLCQLHHPGPRARRSRQRLRRGGQDFPPGAAVGHACARRLPGDRGRDIARLDGGVLDHHGAGTLADRPRHCVLALHLGCLAGAAPAEGAHREASQGRRAATRNAAAEERAVGAGCRDRASGGFDALRRRRVFRDRGGRRARHHRAERLRQVDARARPRRGMADGARRGPLRSGADRPVFAGDAGRRDRPSAPKHRTLRRHHSREHRPVPQGPYAPSRWSRRRGSRACTT